MEKMAICSFASTHWACLQDSERLRQTSWASKKLRLQTGIKRGGGRHKQQDRMKRFHPTVKARTRVWSEKVSPLASWAQQPLNGQAKQAILEWLVGEANNCWFGLNPWKGRGALDFDISFQNVYFASRWMVVLNVICFRSTVTYYKMPTFSMSRLKCWLQLCMLNMMYAYNSECSHAQRIFATNNQ